LKTQALIIGGGVTGAGLARDLSQRGIECILVEKQDFNSGASGGNHGLLHSGARYVTSDPNAAKECSNESDLLKRLAAHCIEDTGGLFIAVEGDDEKYIADFPQLCAKSAIPTYPVDLAEAREMEPNLSPKLIAAYWVEDATVDPFKLTLDNISQAQQLGTRLLRYYKVVNFLKSKRKIKTVCLLDSQTSEEKCIEADIVINASGAWAGEIAAMAGVKFNMLYSKGTLLVTQNRLSQRVINRLRKATDADILVPGGTVSILGTTSVRTKSPDHIYPEVEEVDFIIEEGAAMIPILQTTRYIRAYCGVRPLFGSEDIGDDRSVSRGFALIDHSKDGIDNFITITGGKLTTFRLMAEKAADMVCRRLGISRQCRTHLEPLPSSDYTKWTEPGMAPHVWIKKNDPGDLLLCECEMVSQSAVDKVIQSIHKQDGPLSLRAIGMRSRVGKGPCQGTFCSQRVTSYLHDCGEFEGRRGLKELREFLSERWRGQHPLLWDMPLVQFELQEAMHCGLLGLELSDNMDQESAE
jgi:glycerol-3-phosphate dehydrogenase